MKELKFNIFGSFIAVTGTFGSWRAFYFGTEGKKRAADFVIPDDITEQDLCEYLADLFHENATPRNNVAILLSSVAIG